MVFAVEAVTRLIAAAAAHTLGSGDR